MRHVQTGAVQQMGGDYRSLRESQFVLPQSVQEHLSWTLDDNEGNNDWFADGKVIDFSAETWVMCDNFIFLVESLCCLRVIGS